jgi:hypothetical protein
MIVAQLCAFARSLALAAALALTLAPCKLAVASQSPYIPSQSDSAIELHTNMYRYVFHDNFEFRAFSFKFSSLEILRGLTESLPSLRIFVANRATEICRTSTITLKSCNRASVEVEGATLEKTFGVGAAAELGLWFYRLDGENWFSLDDAHRQTELYFHRGVKELFLFKGFNPEGILVEPLTNRELPVVVDYAEQTITILTLQLND